MILVVDDSGKVVDINSDIDDPDSIPLDGILSPGFINCHCHLELSHLKNKMSTGGGLHSFISQLVNKRSKADPNSINRAIVENDLNMWNNGIQAVGDICNDGSTFSVKKESRVTYYNFIEVFDLKSERTDLNFQNGEAVFDAYQHDHELSITPHAPYSVTPDLFEKIANHNNAIGNNLMSIHFMETASEIPLYRNKSGDLYDMMANLGIDYSWIQAEVENTIDMIMPYMLGKSNLFVHNTFLDQQHIDIMDEKGMLKDASFCLCPNANLYIEGRLPDIDLFRANNLNIVLGTDSLASNADLSIISEINTVIERYPKIPIEELLKWATENGADYFGWDTLGKFEKGKTPGGVLISLVSKGTYQAKRIF
jgi:cytosine/adenosine deaminase-related metal-dependent hydrolase